MPKVVKFTRQIPMPYQKAYTCDQPDDHSGEYEALEALIKRLVEIGPHLTVKNKLWRGTVEELEQLLADCRKVVE